MIFAIKENSIILYNVFLAIATNIPQRLKTGFVLQGHIWLLIIVSSHEPLCIQICNSTIDSWLLCYFRASLEDKCYESDLETALSLSMLDSSRTQDGEPTTKTGECTVYCYNKASWSSFRKWKAMFYCYLLQMNMTVLSLLSVHHLF